MQEHATVVPRRFLPKLEHFSDKHNESIWLGHLHHDLPVASVLCFRGLSDRSSNESEEALVELEVPLVGGVDTGAVFGGQQVEEEAPCHGDG